MKIFKSIFCFIFLFQLFQLSYAASAYAQAQKDVRFGAAVQAEHENALQELRIGSFRVTGCAWSKYQLSRNHMDSNEVAKLDQTINGLYDMGISPIVTVQCIPPGWARSVGDTFGNSTSRLPRDIADYNNFLSALVARYKDKVQYWQIENEINAPGFWGGTLDDYFYLLQNAKSVIKKVDAEKQILLSGLAGVSIEINMLAENGLTAEEKRKIIQFFQEGGVNAGDAEVIISRALEFIPGLLLRGPLYCDIIDLHNYVDSYADIPKVIQWVREKSGYLKPVWITEIGWPGPNRANVTIPPGEEPARAKELVKRILSALGSDNFQEQATDRIFWFSLADGGNWINAGLLKEGGAKKDAYYTYKTLVEKLGSAKFMERRRLSDNTQIYQFESTGAGGKYITVAWNDGGNGKLDSLPHRTNNITMMSRACPL